MKLQNKHSFVKLLLNTFRQIERIFSILLSIILAGVLIVLLVRVIIASYNLIFSKVIVPGTIQSTNVTDLLAKIINLLIILEFMNTVVFIIKSNKFRVLVKDIALLTGLAILRKLIVVDYEHSPALNIISIGVVLIAVGMFYMVTDRKSERTDNHELQNTPDIFTKHNGSLVDVHKKAQGRNADQSR